VLDAARRLFVERGYAAMTMSAVAGAAGVALDTVYEVIGTKPALVRALVETAISGTDEAVAAEDRDYVRRIRATPSAPAKLAIYAAAVRAIHARLAPVVTALRAAAPAHPELGDLWREISARRARNMERFADDLMATGEVRPGLARADVADGLWLLGAPELFVLLVEERGFTPDRFERWVADGWARLILAR